MTAEIIDTNQNNLDFNSLPIKETIMSGLQEREIIIDLCANIDGVQASFPEAILADENGDCFVDVCPNIDGLQVAVPAGFDKILGSDECTIIPLEDAVLVITELYPNAPSADSGQEFIELYNPNTKPVDLAGYSIQVGPNFTKEFIFTSGQITPNEYMTFADTATGIVLPNATGVQLRLVAPAGNVVSETEVYAGAKEGESWATVENQWIWTNQITPGAVNKPFLVLAEEEVLAVTSTLAPCPAGKFRNPETNRCKNIETAVSQLVPCGADEFRNPDTNRCNKVSSTTSSLAPCKAGQVRNPETNRCRSVSSGSSSLQPCDEGEERNPETNRCRKVSALTAGDSNLPSVTDVKVQNSEGQINWAIILVALFSTFTYLLYEWRSELSYSYSRFRQRIVQ